MKSSDYLRSLGLSAAISSIIGGSLLLVTENTKASDSQPSPQFRDAPSFGGSTTKSVESTGYGSSENDAITDALRNAIAQVTGARIESDAGVKGAVKSYAVLKVEQVEVVTGGQRSADSYTRSTTDTVAVDNSVSVDLYQERLLKDDAVGGTAQETFSSRSQSDVAETSSSINQSLDYHWRASVNADVNVFQSANDNSRPKLVISPPILTSNSYTIGDDQISAESLSTQIQNQVTNLLSQTDRFDVLARDSSSQIQAEIDFINSSQSRNQEVARLGQQFSADIILAISVDSFEYKKHSRTMRTADRELISYDGAASISMQLLNPTTGVLVASRTIEVDMPAVEPTTMASPINAQKVTSDAVSKLTTQIAETVIIKLFPISVISISSNEVVLSQGGKTLEAGSEYEAVILGDELIDPQTQRRLGRDETRCCTIRIDQVGALTSHGSIVGELHPRLESFVPGMVELRNKIIEVPQPRATRQEATPTSTLQIPERKELDDSDW